MVNWVYDLVFFSISEVTREKFKFIGNSKIEMRNKIGTYVRARKYLHLIFHSFIHAIYQSLFHLFGFRFLINF